MTAKLLEGEPLAAKIRDEVGAAVEQLSSKGVQPKLVAVSVGENPASRSYIKKQAETAESLGITYQELQFPETISQRELEARIDELNRDSQVHAIILQLPVPEHIDEKRIQHQIVPVKDVEGLHPENMGRLIYGTQTVAPCTAMSVIEHLKSTGEQLRGKEAVIVGRSEIVGRPVFLLMLQMGKQAPTPTICHTATRDLAFHTGRADILVAAAGRAGLISGEMIKEGAIIIDVGMNRVPVLDEHGKPVLTKKGKPKKKFVGDVVFEQAVEKASYITPVPGGVGPVTAILLMRNVVECTRAQMG